MKTKPAITMMTTTILVSVLAAGLASAQNPTIIQSTRNTMNGVSNHAAAASNEAWAVHDAVPSAASARAAAHSNRAAAGPAKTSAVRTISVSPKAPSVKKREHERRGGAILVEPIAPPAPSPVPEEKAEAPATPSVASSSAVDDSSEQSVVPDGKYAANGRRDPFISPVVSHAGGSGCSTGKKCLEIGAINLRGVVHYENGFIAVVSNSMNKAYFLRENDPVFNGYVVKITGDSIVFQETLQDRLGKTFTREVVKKITTPAV